MGMKKTSLVDLVKERIKGYIVKNNLKPNDKFLSEGELTEQLKVSRTVVREALISLQAVGIIEVKAGGGVYIADTKLDAIHSILKHHYETNGVRIKELVEIRKVIELGALRLIIEKNVNVPIKKLYDINESYYQSIIRAEDTTKYDQQFHQLLIKTTENQTFYNFSEIINEYFALTKIDWVQKEDELINSFHEHNQLIEAIKKQNLVETHQIMTQHFKPIFTFINQMEEKL